MEANEQILIPHISAAKHDRILIWRNEVATASLDPDANDGASSSATSTTTTSTSTSSSSSSSRLARSRVIISKLAHKLRPSSWRGRPNDDDDEGAVTRTAMYATLSPDYSPDEEELEDGEDGAPPRDAALREKQQRLMRAARLLDKDRV